MTGLLLVKKSYQQLKKHLKWHLKIKKPHNQLITRLFVNAEGFEPSTACLEGRCSIQLSYASICF